MATTKLEDVLAFVPLFRGLTKRQLKHLASLMDVADYMADAAIVSEGTKGDAFYVVLKGQATVTMNEHFLTQARPGRPLRGDRRDRRRDALGDSDQRDAGEARGDDEEVALEGAPRRPGPRALS